MPVQFLPVSRRLLVSAIALALAAPIAAAEIGTLATAVAATDENTGAQRSRARRLEEVEVEGQAPTAPASPKYTQPLLETPQSIAIVPSEVIKGQNLLSLREILSTLPGITFGAGEGGGGYGDSINLRGFTANNDIAIDGVRDSAQYSRTDTFNLEQVEVVNGANSVYSGSSSVGGSINLVSKRATNDDVTHVGVAAGADGYGRMTIDANHVVNAGTALRVNLMNHQNDAAGRDVENFARRGIAPTLTFGMDGATQVSLGYLHQTDDNIPQYGVPFFNGAPLPGVDSASYFGYSNVDTQQIDTDVATAIVDHAFSDTLSLRNLTRIGKTDQLSIVNPTQGTFCLDNGINPATGAACTAPGTYLPSGPRGNERDTTNRVIANQTDFLYDFTTGVVEHNAVFGLSLTREEFELASGNAQRTSTGTVPAYPLMDLDNPDHVYTGPHNYFLASTQVGELDSAALYAFDTMHFNERWSINGGFRFDRSEGTHRSDTHAVNGTVTEGPLLRNNDDLMSYRAGVVYKPGNNGSVYLALGNSKTPSKASVNGACTVATCNVDPETAISYELGTKWDLLDARLSLTASLFRNDRENYKVADPSNPANPSGEQQLDGEARVDGVLLGVSGLINDHWLVYANYSHLESEVLQGVSDLQAQLGTDYARGDRLTNTPEDALSLWTTYDVSPKWQLGYGATYQGQVWLTQHSATNINGPLVTYGDYWTQRAMAAYRVTRDLRLQLNATNLFDEAYYTRIRNNGWATPGEGRSFVLSADYAF